MEQGRRYGEGIARMPQTFARERGAQAALDAEQLILALTAVAATRPELQHEATKHEERLRFALDRLRDLRAVAAATPDVGTRARAEVALSILEGQVALTAGFINRTMSHLRRRPGRRETQAAADEAMTAVDEEGAESEAA